MEKINKAKVGSPYYSCKYSPSVSGAQPRPNCPSWVWAALSDSPPKTEDGQGEIRCEGSPPCPYLWGGPHSTDESAVAKFGGWAEAMCVFKWDPFTGTHSSPQPWVSGARPRAGCLQGLMDKQTNLTFTELRPNQHIHSNKNTDDQKVTPGCWRSSDPWESETK